MELDVLVRRLGVVLRVEFSCKIFKNLRSVPD